MPAGPVRVGGLRETQAATQEDHGATCQGQEEQECGMEDSGGHEPGRGAAGIEEEVPVSIRGRSEGRAGWHSGVAGRLGIQGLSGRGGTRGTERPEPLQSHI